MLHDDDLTAAVAEGVVTEAHAAALREFALKRARQRAAVEGPEEHFRFMRGFNDFFLAIGVVLLGSSMFYFLAESAVGGFVGAAITWALAELLVGRMRLVLPGILLTCIFIIFVFEAVPIDRWFGSSSLFGSAPPQTGLAPSAIAFGIAIRSLVAGGAALLFYARFRLPFALLPIAASIVAAVVATVAALFDSPMALSIALLCCGLMVFAVAMRFDMSDRDRVTRRSDCAFWLHLLAAPMIVHSLISLVTNSPFNMSTVIAATIFAIVAVLTFVAITIDRRALLVSTLAYLGGAIGYAITRMSINSQEVMFYTLAVLGLMVVALGVGWLPLRRLLLARLPMTLTSRLPTVPAKP